MRRPVKTFVLRAAIGAAVLLAIGLLAAAVLAWRATRVPAWYAAAVDATPSDSDADATLKDRIYPLQNWLAKAGSGDPDSKPDAEKIFTLELTEPQVNALLAKFLDHLQGPARTFRVRLLPGGIDVGFTWAEQGRTVGVTAAVAKAADGRPTVALGGLRVGDQAIPASWVAGEPARQVRAALVAARQAGKPPRIDDQDAVPRHTVEAYYGRLLLAVLSGRAVSPEAILPRGVAGGTWVAARVTRLDVTAGRLSATFRLMTAEERAAVVAELAGPLPGS